MTYEYWINDHYLKHKNIMAKLKHLPKEEIIQYFDFENMKEKEKDFCLLYGLNKKCHDIKSLNCYMCACPYFRLEDTHSYCAINSRFATFMKDDTGFNHLDCTNCFIPHKVSYIKKNYKEDWSTIMKDVIKKEK
jgi:Zn-finger protein